VLSTLADPEAHTPDGDTVTLVLAVIVVANAAADVPATTPAATKVMSDRRMCGFLPVRGLGSSVR
jgi:hypothetical protein